MDGDDKQLRSLQDDLVTWVRFINRTRRNVDVFWLDYVGTRVKYSTLQPGDAYDIQTFVTHPWIFLDAETACPLRAEGKEVFHPRPEDPDALGPSENIYIDIPVYTLKELCKEVVRRRFSTEKLNHLSSELPADILVELLHANIAVPYKSV